MSIDLTLCTGLGCPLRAECYRYRVIAHGRRSSFATPPFVAAAGTCAHLLPLPTIGEDDVRTRAYVLWDADGRPDDRADEHWLRAEAELNDELGSRLRPVG
ncbi:MAG: DUF2934 domain-containing protein [Alphaproteobacteria bacterium]|nr:DUF2934 domain-containing protein [Alphaproteobacteria bacterium]